MGTLAGTGTSAKPPQTTIVTLSALGPNSDMSKVDPIQVGAERGLELVLLGQRVDALVTWLKVQTAMPTSSSQILPEKSG
jgi:hypothetical protein